MSSMCTASEAMAGDMMEMYAPEVNPYKTANTTMLALDVVPNLRKWSVSVARATLSYRGSHKANTSTAVEKQHGRRTLNAPNRSARRFGSVRPKTDPALKNETP